MKLIVCEKSIYWLICATLSDLKVENMLCSISFNYILCPSCYGF